MDLEYLNRKLKDALGNAPSGDPLFKWVHAKDLTIRQKRIEGEGWIDIPQIDETAVGDGMVMGRPAHRWVLATWQPPQFTRDQYRAMFGDSMPYSRNGRYVATDTILQRGIEPDEGVTDLVIGKEKARRHLTRQQMEETLVTGAQRSRQAVLEKSKGIVREAFGAYSKLGHVPGTKDNVSFRSI